MNNRIMTEPVYENRWSEKHQFHLLNGSLFLFFWVWLKSTPVKWDAPLRTQMSSAAFTLASLAVVT